MCFGIAKLECQMYNIIGYFFSLFYMPVHDLLKKKTMQKKKKLKSKKIKILYIWLQAYILGDVGVIGCTSKMIVSIKQLWLCVILISQIVITYIHLCNLVMFFTHNMQYSFLFLIHVQVRCDLAITRFYMYSYMLTKLSWLVFEI